MSKIDNITKDTEVLIAIDKMMTTMGDQVISEWDSEKAIETYQEYLANADKYDGKSVTASKAYFNDYLNGKLIKTKIGLVRINSKSRGKIHDRMRDVKYLAIPYIPEVLMTGDVSDLAPLNKDRTDSVVGYYEFKKSKEFNDYVLNITLKVALDIDGKLLYFLGASRVKSGFDSAAKSLLTPNSQVVSFLGLETGFSKNQLTDYLTGSRPHSAEVGFDSIESQEDDEINIDVQVLDKNGNVLSDEEAEKLIFGNFIQSTELNPSENKLRFDLGQFVASNGGNNEKYFIFAKRSSENPKDEFVAIPCDYLVLDNKFFATSIKPYSENILIPINIDDFHIIQFAELKDKKILNEWYDLLVNSIDIYIKQSKANNTKLIIDFEVMSREQFLALVDKLISRVDDFDSVDENGQSVLDKIDSMINVLQSLHGSENNVLKGRSNNVKTAKGTKVSTVFAVLEADQVIASHTATGAENPNYPQELQPRDRSRESSQAWVQKTSNTLDPESLGRSGRADTGAPIVGDDLVVESGNGRTMAIQLAYERGNADEYKQWLIDEAEYFGFNADAIAQFNQPILVRIRTSEVDRVQFTVEANQDDKLSFSATERAKSDAKRLDENLLSLFIPGDDGDLLTVANLKFIQGFLKSLGETEAAQYITKDGKPTQALVTRIKAAIFSKAYNDDRLLEMMADQTKPDLQNMLNALGAAAPKFIEAQSVSRGNVQDVSSSIVDGIEQALDKRVANAIIDAANTILAAKHNDQDIAEFVKQQGLFGDLGEGVPELAIFLSKNSRSAKKMSLLFKAMAEFAEKQALDQQNIGLFGDPEPVSIKDAIDYAVNIIEENYGENTNLSMFDSIFTPTSFDQKAHEAATSPLNDLELPSIEQKESGDYQKGHLAIGDLNIAIENPAGSIRSGTDAQGNEWRIRMQHHYGFIENTTGADGDEIDVFVKNHLDHIPDHAYIINQLDKDGKFDEHKVILGAETEDEAKEIYLSNYEQDWQGLGDIKRISMADLLQKIQHTWSEFDSVSNGLVVTGENVLRVIDSLISSLQEAV